VYILKIETNEQLEILNKMFDICLKAGGLQSLNGVNLLRQQIVAQDVDKDDADRSE